MLVEDIVRLHYKKGFYIMGNPAIKGSNTRDIRIFIILGIILFLPNSSVFLSSTPYPDAVRTLTESATKIIRCDANSSLRRVSSTSFEKEGAEWLVRIFFADGQELEAWVHFSKSFFALWYPDLVFYYDEPRGWTEKKTLPKEIANTLDSRIKFTPEEISALADCYKKNK